MTDEPSVEDLSKRVQESQALIDEATAKRDYHADEAANHKAAVTMWGVRLKELHSGVAADAKALSLHFKALSTAGRKTRTPRQPAEPVSEATEGPAPTAKRAKRQPAGAED